MYQSSTVSKTERSLAGLEGGGYNDRLEQSIYVITPSTAFDPDSSIRFFDAWAMEELCIRQRGKFRAQVFMEIS